MNILLVYGGKYPSFGAASKRITNYVNGLALFGDKAKVLSVYPVNSNRSILYLWSLFYPVIALIKVSKNLKHIDLVFIYGLGWIGKLLVIIISKLFGKKTVLEFNEYPYSIYGSRRDKYLRFFRSFNRLCLNSLVIPLADGFVVISDPLYHYIDKLKASKSKIILIPILVDFEYYQLRALKPDCNVPFILHSATLNDKKDGISDVFYAVAAVNRILKTPLHFYLTSKVALAETWRNIRQIINENDLDNYTHFLGDLDEKTLLAYQQHCDMVVLNKVDSIQNRYNFATKLGEYLALGKPVVATSIGEMSKFLISNQNFIEIEQSSSSEIAKALIYLLNNPEKKKQIGENGRLLAKDKFDFKHHCLRLSDFFMHL